MFSPFPVESFVGIAINMTIFRHIIIKQVREKISSYRVFLSIERKTVTSAVGMGSSILLEPSSGTCCTKVDLSSKSEAFYRNGRQKASSKLKQI